MTDHLLFVSTTFASDGSDLEEVAAACAARGLRRLELGSNHAPPADPLGTVRRHGLDCLVHNYFPAPAQPFVLNVASLDDAIWRRSVEHVRSAVDFCAASGARLYTFHPGFVTDPSGPGRGGGGYDFLFTGARAGGPEREAAEARMREALDEIVPHARSRGVRIALETEGSVRHAPRLLLQTPEDCARLLRVFAPDELGISLNLGHLPLAARAFGFEPGALVEQVADRVVAMELSHNGGLEDEHRPLEAGAWYWPIIRDPRFRRAFKILEFRDTALDRILDNLKLFETPTPCPSPI